MDFTGISCLPPRAGVCVKYYCRCLHGCPGSWSSKLTSSLRERVEQMYTRLTVLLKLISSVMSVPTALASFGMTVGFLVCCWLSLAIGYHS